MAWENRDEERTTAAADAVVSARRALAEFRAWKATARRHVATAQALSGGSDVVRAARLIAREELYQAKRAVREARAGLVAAQDHKRRNSSWGSLAMNTACCHRAQVGDWMTIRRSRESGKASMAGVQVCAGATRCPLCASRIGAGRARDMGQGLRALHAMGGYAVMLTQTASHQADTDTVWMVEALLRACGRFWESGSVKRALASIGVVGRIYSLEITDGRGTGPHPHRHNVLCLSHRPTDEDMSEFRRIAATAWVRACQAEGLFADEEHGTHLAHRLDVDEDDADRVAYYLNKLGLEVALVASKCAAGGRYTLGELLAAAHGGDVWAARRWNLWQVALRGRSLVKWSRDLRTALGLDEIEPTDEALAAGEDETHDDVVRITREDARKVQGWRGYHDFDLRPWLLEAAESEDGDRAELLGIAAALGITLHVPLGASPPGPFETVCALTDDERTSRRHHFEAPPCDAEDLFHLAGATHG